MTDQEIGHIFHLRHSSRLLHLKATWEAPVGKVESLSMIAGVGHLTACPPEQLADLLKQTYKTHFEGGF